MRIEEWKKQSKAMFDTANDPQYLLCDSVRGEIDRAVIEQFLKTKINKTDFQVLNELMQVANYIIEDSFFILKDFEGFIRGCEFKISKPNLSRSLKALCENGFIEKVPHIDNKINYKFLTAFKKLEELT